MKLQQQILNCVLLIVLCSLGMAQSQLSAGLPLGTKILTSHGPVAVEELTFETPITGYNPEDQTFPSLKIKQMCIALGSDLMVIETDLGVIKCSGEHKLYEVVRNDFVEAHALKVGDILLTSKRELCVCKKIDCVTNLTKSYDISLDDPHVFFSSDAQILTHNAAPVALAASVFEAIIVVAAIGIVAVFDVCKKMGGSLAQPSHQNFLFSASFQSMIPYDVVNRMAPERTITPPTIQRVICQPGRVSDGIFIPDETLSAENAQASINAYYKTGNGQIKVYTATGSQPSSALHAPQLNFQAPKTRSLFDDATIKISTSTSTHIMAPIFFDGRDQLKYELLDDGNLGIVWQKICVPGVDTNGRYVYEWGDYRRATPLDRYAPEAKDTIKIIDEHDLNFVKSLVASWPQNIYEEFEWSVGFVDEGGLDCNRRYRNFGCKLKEYMFTPLALFQMAQANIPPSAVLYAIHHGRRKSSFFALKQKIYAYGAARVMFHSWNKEVWGVGGASNALFYEEDPKRVVALQADRRVPLATRNRLRNESLEALARRRQVQALEIEKQEAQAALEVQQLAALNATRQLEQSITVEATETEYEQLLLDARAQARAGERVAATMKRDDCKFKHLDRRARYIKMLDELTQHNRDHILSKKHLWDILVPNSSAPENWSKIRDIIVDTLMTIPEYIHSSGACYFKLLEINGQAVEVRYVREMKCCITAISNAFVREVGE